MKLSKQLTRRECVLLAILGVLFLFAVYLFTVHRPVTENLAHIRQAQEDVDIQMVALEAKAQRMAQMRGELDEVAQQPNKAEIPRYDNLEQLMGFLNTLLAPVSDYSLSFSGQTPVEGSDILRRSMDLSFTCTSYQDARDIILRLQACPYRCQLNNLSISFPSQQTQSDSVPPLRTAEAITVSLNVTFFESTRS